MYKVFLKNGTGASYYITTGFIFMLHPKGRLDPHVQDVLNNSIILEQEILPRPGSRGATLRRYAPGETSFKNVNEAELAIDVLRTYLRSFEIDPGEDIHTEKI